MAKNDTILKKLSAFFSITSKKDKTTKKTVVTPASIDKNTGKVNPLGLGGSNSKVPKEIENIWNFFVKNNYDTPDTMKNRFDRYSDLEFIYYNDVISSMAVDLVTDETISPDSEEQEIGVYAKNPKTEKIIRDFIDNTLKIRGSTLREISFNLALYGDSFGITSVDSEKGIMSFSLMGVYDVKQRLEFSLPKIAELMQQDKVLSQYMDKSKGLYQIYQSMVEDDGNIAEYFKDFLFGFALSNEIWLPPWNIAHFRRYSRRSEFFPFGKPPFIHMVAPYRQYSSTLNLQAMARIASFPIKHFEVRTDERETQADQWRSVQTTRQSFGNLGLTNTGKDEFSVNDEIWTPEGLLKVNVIENRMDVDKIADLEMLQNRMIVAGRIPKDYLPFGDGSRLNGNSGKSLVQQSKTFARFVYPNQQALLETVSNLVKIHLTLTGQATNEDYELFLPYPVLEENSDRLRNKNDTMRLAKDVLENLGAALGLNRGEALPIDIVKDVYAKYSFLDSDEIEDWIKTYQKESEIIEESRKSTITKRYNAGKESLLREAHFSVLAETKQQEYIRGGNHYVTSYLSDGHTENLLELFKNKKRAGSLRETLEENKESVFKAFTETLSKKRNKN